MYLVLLREKGLKLFQDVTTLNQKSDDLDELYCYKSHAEASDKCVELCQGRGLSAYADQYLNRMVLVTTLKL